jgi:hypothetical protein
MTIETITNMAEQTSLFARAAFKQDGQPLVSDVLDYDGNVMMMNTTSIDHKHDIWNALHLAVTESNAQIIFVTPTVEWAEGTMMSISDSIGRSPFTKSGWGMKQHTQTELEFENGSVIHVASEPNQLRGYKPDLLVVENEIHNRDDADEYIDDVLAPMPQWTEQLWLNVTGDMRQDERLFGLVLDDGAMVYRLTDDD